MFIFGKESFLLEDKHGFFGGEETGRLNTTLWFGFQLLYS
jgi:hypothetical protein